MTRMWVARTVGAAVGVGAILFFAISAVAAYALSSPGAEIADYALPAVLALFAVAGTIGVVRARAWGTLVIATTLVVPLVRMLMIDAATPEWIAILAVAIGLELAVTLVLAGRLDGRAAQT